MLEKNNQITQFTDKYEFTNLISRLLITRFFNSIKSLCPKKLSTVLEVGCGAGYSTRILYNHLKPIKFLASDIDPQLVSLTKERTPEVDVKVESIYNLQHSPASCDLVFALEVFEHLDNPILALQEIKKITNKYIIISVPREPLWRILNICRGKYLKYYGNTPGHINHWSTNSFKKFISTEFKIIKVKTSIPWTIILAQK